MKALRLVDIGDLRLVEMEPPKPASDELLVRTMASTICTSDINDLKHNAWGISLPVIMGHEAAGTVVEVGDKAAGFRPGDRIAAHPVHHCRRCLNCREGRAHLCSDMRHFGINMQGTFAEYFVVRADRARGAVEGVDFAVAALAEPVSVCLEALAQARLLEGQTLLVMGDGPFGIIMARLARSMKLSRTVVAGHHDFRLSMAGPDAVKVNTTGLTDAVGTLKAAVDGGFDAMILAVGSAEAFDTGLSCLKAKGRAVVFSAVTGLTGVDLFRLHVNELEIIGACNDDNMLDRAVMLLPDERLALGQLVTHRLPLEEFERAFALAQKGREEAMKVAFVFEREEGDG